MHKGGRSKNYYVEKNQHCTRKVLQFKAEQLPQLYVTFVPVVFGQILITFQSKKKRLKSPQEKLQLLVSLE